MCNIWPEALAIQKGLDSICIGIDNKKLCEIAGEASKYRIEIQQQLAAANARVEELEKERNNYLSFGQGGASFSDSQWLDKLATTEQRAEQAEAQCKRMEVALREISNVTSKCLSHEEMKDKMKKIAKAALEEKP